jgi:hypothetical protein
MDPCRGDRKPLESSENDLYRDQQYEIVGRAFLELFELLEEYAPTWYTEQHHERAFSALRVLKNS